MKHNEQTYPFPQSMLLSTEQLRKRVAKALSRCRLLLAIVLFDILGIDIVARESEAERGCHVD